MIRPTHSSVASADAPYLHFVLPQGLHVRLENGNQPEKSPTIKLHTHMQFIKQHLADLILGVIVIFLGLYIILHIPKKKEILSNIQEMQAIRDDSTSYWRDKYDQEHAAKFMVEGDLQEIKTVWGDQLKSKTEELGVKEKQIKSMVSFSTRQGIALDSLVKKYSSRDTSIIKGTNGKPDVMVIETRLPPGLTIPIDDSLSVANYYKKTGFLGFKKTFMTDIVSYNGSHIQNIQSFQIREPGPVIKFRPVLSAIYTEKRFLPAVGVGAEFKVIGIPVTVTLQKAFP
jgi:hypothetical protein